MARNIGAVRVAHSAANWWRQTPRSKKLGLAILTILLLVTAAASIYAPTPRPYHIATLVLLVVASVGTAYSLYRAWTLPKPELRLAFPEQEEERLTLSPTFCYGLEERLGELARQRYPDPISYSLLFPTSFGNPLDPSLDEKREYFQDWLRYAACLAQTSDIWFDLHNDGRLGAQQVDLCVTFPESYEVTLTLSEPPRCPPSPLSNVQVEMLGLMVEEFRRNRQVSQQQVSVDQRKRQVRFRVPYVNPGISVRLGPVYVVPRAESHEAMLEYWAVCQGHPERGAVKFSGKLRLVCQQATEPTLDDLVRRYRKFHPEEETREEGAERRQ